MARKFSQAPFLLRQQVQQLFDMGFWQRFAVEFLPPSAYVEVPKRARGEETLVRLSVREQHSWPHLFSDYNRDSRLTEFRLIEFLCEPFSDGKIFDFWLVTCTSQAKLFSWVFDLSNPF